MTDKLYTQAEVDEQVRLARAEALRGAANRIQSNREARGTYDSSWEQGYLDGQKWSIDEILGISPEYSHALNKHDEKLRAEAAAVMEKLVSYIEHHELWKHYHTSARPALIAALRSFIPTAYADALDKLIAKARLESAESLINMAPGRLSDAIHDYMAELRRAVEGATDAAGKGKSNVHRDIINYFHSPETQNAIRDVPIDTPPAAAEAVCPRCEGKRWGQGLTRCPDCHGTGRLRAQGKGE